MVEELPAHIAIVETMLLLIVALVAHVLETKLVTVVVTILRDESMLNRDTIAIESIDDARRRITRGWLHCQPGLTRLPIPATLLLNLCLLEGRCRERIRGFRLIADRRESLSVGVKIHDSSLSGWLLRVQMKVEGRRCSEQKIN